MVFGFFDLEKSSLILIRWPELARKYLKTDTDRIVTTLQSRKAGSERDLTSAAMERVCRTWARPPQSFLRPHISPLSQLIGATPASAGSLPIKAAGEAKTS